MPEPLAFRHAAFVIAGPTAVGKTGVAIEVARRCGGEIVGADAFQIYEGFDLLTAKPSPAERAQVPHHLIGEVPPGESFDVARYLAIAGPRLADIRRRGKVPIIAGGSGLYLRALLRGLAELPPADAALRAELEKEPLAALRERFRALDPAGAAAIDLQNPRRVVRALEVCLLTGRPFSGFREEWSAPPPRAAGVVLLREREDLRRRIDARVEAMFAGGVVEEVRRAPATGATASQILGLADLRAHLAGALPRGECIAAIALATRQYAKRQATWFRREPALEPRLLAPGEPPDAWIEELAHRAGGNGRGG